MLLVLLWNYGVSIIVCGSVGMARDAMASPNERTLDDELVLEDSREKFETLSSFCKGSETSETDEVSLCILANRPSDVGTPLTISTCSAIASP